jgi:RHS repeat-associated protein
MFTRVGRHNEYYPFGLQTAKSWTRDNSTANNFLANGGTELNPTSNLYDLDFRNYDPVLGRLNQVDPMADKYGSFSPYHFSFNNPVSFNDPSGLEGMPAPGSIAYGTYVPGPQWIAGDQARNIGGSGGWIAVTTTYVQETKYYTNGRYDYSNYELTKEAEYYFVGEGDDQTGEKVDPNATFYLRIDVLKVMTWGYSKILYNGRTFGDEDYIRPQSSLYFKWNPSNQRLEFFKFRDNSVLVPEENLNIDYNGSRTYGNIGKTEYAIDVTAGTTTLGFDLYLKNDESSLAVAQTEMTKWAIRVVVSTNPNFDSTNGAIIGVKQAGVDSYSGFKMITDFGHTGLEKVPTKKPK